MTRTHLLNDERSISTNRQGLKPLFFRSLDVAAEAATHKAHLSAGLALLTSWNLETRNYTVARGFGVARLFRGGAFLPRS